MGCGAAKAVQTEDMNGSNGTVVTDGIKVMSNGTNGIAVRRLSKAETRPMTPGNRTYRKSLKPKQLPPTRKGVLSRARETIIYSTIFLPKPVAFEIPINERRSSKESINSNSENINRKQPPKRLLTLAEQPSQHLTAEELKEKQMRVEEKRLELLEERKLKAHKYNEKFNNNSIVNNNHNSENNNINDIKNVKNENETKNNEIIITDKENKSS